MQLNEVVEVAGVGGLKRIEVSASHGIVGRERGFRPLDNLAVMVIEPDVGKEASPSTVSVEERVDENGSVVEASDAARRG